MLSYAQSGGVSGLEKKAEPASSSRSDKDGSRTKTIDYLESLKVLYPFWYKNQDITLWGARQ